LKFGLIIAMNGV